MFSVYFRASWINIFNKLNPKRNYCAELGQWRLDGGVGRQTAFKFTRPQKRHWDLEIGGTWSYSGLVFEVGIRREGPGENL